MTVKYILFLFFVVGGSQWAGAAVSNATHVIGCAGEWSSGGSYSNISSVAQPGGVALSSSGTLVNSAGFLNTIILSAGLDSDGDGLADELDSDNDNDSLSDLDELTGSKFAPATVTDVNVADSDDDGSGDGDEAVAGTNPNDGSARLVITSVKKSGNDILVNWQARSNRMYRVRESLDLVADGAFTTVVANAVLVTNSATPPWYITTTSYRHVGAATNSNERFYTIEVY